MRQTNLNAKSRRTVDCATIVQRVRQAAQPELVTLAGAAEMTGLSPFTWRNRAAAGDVESVKVFGRICIPLREVRRVIDAGRRPGIVEQAREEQERG